MRESIETFHLPKYSEIPNVGLYLEQTVKYINSNLEPLGFSITASMLSNYVKQGYISRPIKKQYYAEQIAYLLFISLAKQVLSMEHITDLFSLQKKTFTIETAYTYFCTELECMLKNIFSGDDLSAVVPRDLAFPKKTLRCVVTSVAYIIYLNYCFEQLRAENRELQIESPK